MTSLRLTDVLEKKISEIAVLEKTTKSELIKRALNEYIKNYINNIDPYEAGKDLFDQYGSGASDNSKKYKIKIKEILRFLLILYKKCGIINA